MIFDQEIRTIEGYNLYGMQCKNQPISSFQENILVKLQNPEMIPKSIKDSKLKLNIINLPYQILQNFEANIKSAVGRPSNFNTSNPRERLEELKRECVKEGKEWNWKYLSRKDPKYMRFIVNFEQSHPEQKIEVPGRTTRKKSKKSE